MKMNEAFPSSTFSADDLKESGPKTLTVAGCEKRTFQQDNGPDETRPVLTFNETEKACVLNRTRWAACEGLFGSADSDDWIGKQLTLAAGTTQFGRKTVGCVVVTAPNSTASDTPF